MKIKVKKKTKNRVWHDSEASLSVCLTFMRHEINITFYISTAKKKFRFGLKLVWPAI